MATSVGATLRATGTVASRKWPATRRSITSLQSAPDHVDFFIVGGGVLGSAVAHFLSARFGRSVSIAVLERDHSYQYASFARSNSCIRQQYTTPASVQMMRFAVDFLRQAPEALACAANPEPNVSFQERGYLFLGDEAKRTSMQELNAMQRSLGADVQLVDAEELRRRFPWLNLDDIGLGSLGVTGEGWFDPHGLLTAFRKKAESDGVTYLKGTAVGFEVQGQRLAAVNAEDEGVQRTLKAGVFINCAGAWAKQVAALAGCSIPVDAKKRCLFVVDTPQSEERQRFWSTSPFIIDPSGVFIRPETSGKFICGFSRIDEDKDHECAGLPHEIENADYSIFQDIIWPTLANRVPMLEAMRVIHSWAGFYEVCTLDHNCILGLHPDRDNFWLCNGFSGHGMMQAAPAARALVELLASGHFETLDLSCFGYDRVLRNEPILELAVV